MTSPTATATHRRPTEYAAAATFPPDPAAAAAAREFVRASLARNAVSSFEAEVIVSELAGNVVRHAGTHFTVSVHLAGTIRLSVVDNSPVIREIVHPADYAEGGRGLLVVDALSSEWGVKQTLMGKCVWAEVDPAAA